MPSTNSTGPAGEKIIKCRAPIGSATCPIATGAHVHLHNMKSDYLPTFIRSDMDDALCPPGIIPRLD